MRITTGTAIHHASAVVVEAHTVVNEDGHVTKWLTFSIKNAEGREDAHISVFDLELTDLVVQQNFEEIAA
jgi:hypothetical protein|tara:strand:- start:5893 stop:6102 length:210 start_codon:yes stop_codon:yes gene_type:complete